MGRVGTGAVGDGGIARALRSGGEAQEHVLEALAPGPQVGEGQVVLREPRREGGDGGGRGRRVDPVLAGGLLDHHCFEPRPEIGDVEARRRAEADLVPGAGRHELGGRAHADDLAVVDDDDAVGQLLGLVEVVGGDEYADTVVAELADHLTDELAAGHVDPRGRLVEEGDLGAAHQRQGQGEALGLAAREAAHRGGGPLDQADPLEQVVGVLGARVVRGEQAEGLPGGDAWVDAALLQHHADAAGEGLVVAPRVEPQHPHRAGGGGAVALEGLHRAGLAGAVGPEQSEHLAGLGVHRQPVHRSERTVPDAEIGHLDSRHG